MDRSQKYLAFLKLGIVLLLVVASVILSRNLHRQADKTDDGYLTEAMMEQGNVFFIGSSRTRSSINDSMLNRKFNSNGFVNIGLDNSSFLFNKIVASRLLEQGGPKTIFVELAVLNARLPTGYQLLAGDDWVVKEMELLIQVSGIEDFRRIVWPVYEQASISRIRLGPAIKAFRGQTLRTGPVGFLPAVDTAIEFSPQKPVSNDEAVALPVHPLYHHLVSDLLQKAKRTGSRVIFFISPALKTIQEKNTLVNVFSTLPPQHKLVYDPLFLEALYNNRYFKDHTHMNSAGAALFTRYIAEQMILQEWVAKP